MVATLEVKVDGDEDQEPSGGTEDIEETLASLQLRYGGAIAMERLRLRAQAADTQVRYSRTRFTPRGVPSNLF